VTGGLLHVAEGDAGVKRRGDERVAERVGSHALDDPGTSGDAAHDTIPARRAMRRTIRPAACR
jgi:hypothetical protein